MAHSAYRVKCLIALNYLARFIEVETFTRSKRLAKVFLITCGDSLSEVTIYHKTNIISFETTSWGQIEDTVYVPNGKK